MSEMYSELKIPTENRLSDRLKGCIIGFLKGGAIGAKYTNSEDITH